MDVGEKDWALEVWVGYDDESAQLIGSLLILMDIGSSTFLLGDREQQEN